MGNGSASAAFLVILNIVYVVLGLAITAASIWFFIEVYSLTSLRNENHYLLDYKVYWPQAVPWMFLFAGLFVLLVSGCGFAGAKQKSRPMILIYLTFQVITLILLIGASILALVMADSKSSDDFVADTIWDAFNNMQEHRDIEVAFGNIERKYQCCGAMGPRDYKKTRSENFPMSCCQSYYNRWSGEYLIDCDYTNKLANERLGCAEVAKWYARVAIKAFAGTAIFTAFIGILNIVAAFTLSKSLKRGKPRVVVAQYEADSKKVLL